MSESFRSARERILSMNHGIEDEAAGAEQTQGGSEAATAGSDQRDLIDDDASHVDWEAVIDGGLEDDRAAWAHEGEGGLKPFSGAGGINDVSEGGRG